MELCFFQAGIKTVRNSKFHEWLALNNYCMLFKSMLLSDLTRVIPLRLNNT